MKTVYNGYRKQFISQVILEEGDSAVVEIPIIVPNSELGVTPRFIGLVQPLTAAGVPIAITSASYDEVAGNFVVDLGSHTVSGGEIITVLGTFVPQGILPDLEEDLES